MALRGILALVMSLVLVAAAKADLSANLASLINNGNGTFTYSYNLTLSAVERADPAATSGDNPPGTFVTIYDFQGLVNVASTPLGWTSSIQNTGITPSLINGSAFDNPVIPNITFTYTGSPFAGPATITGFNVISNLSATQIGKFTGQATSNTSGTSGQTDQNVGPVLVPAAVPEANSLWLVAIGAMGLAPIVRARARRKS